MSDHHQPRIFDHTDECRSCRARIIWGVTPKGQRIPLEAAPERNLYVVVPGTDELAPIRHAHRSHFDRCPEASQWSGSRRGGS